MQFTYSSAMGQDACATTSSTIESPSGVLDDCIPDATSPPLNIPDPPTVTLSHIEDILTITVTGRPNAPFELTISGPGDETYTETGRLYGPTVSVSITNPSKGGWNATAHLYDEAGNASDATTSSTFEAPEPPAGQPTSAELASGAALENYVAPEPNNTGGVDTVPLVAGGLLAAAAVAAATLKLRRGRASH